MSYTALYRKFRPKNFSEVVGQDHVVQTLKNQIIAGIITIFAEVVTGIVILSISIIVPLLFYAIGEITEILHDIKTNSEHIRDYLEKRG